LFKIGEFSRLTQVSVRMLRYYDKNNLLKPEKVDLFTGYRYYSSNQIQDLHRIIFLRNLGYSTHEIFNALKNWNGAFMHKQLKNKKAEIEKNIQQEKLMVKNLEKAINSIKNDNILINYDFNIKKIPDLMVLSLRKTVPDYFYEGSLWEELEKFTQKNKVSLPLNQYNFAIYHDTNYKETDIDIEVCSVVEKTGKNTGNFTYRKVKGIDNMACTMVLGPYERIASAFLAFMRWLSEQPGYKMSGKNRQICHRGPWNTENPAKYLTEIQIPLKKI
jgi:DNA-binding transcriptional MerR regulator/DNA gyrase inhibitor GyrI